jgi:hypothetical protein
MKSIKFLVLSFIALAALSCTNNKSKDNTTEVVDESLSDATIWNSDFIKVDNILITDSIVWVHSEQAEEQLLYAYNLNGELLASGIGLGNGKDELLELTALHTDNNGNPTIYDSKVGKIYNVVRDGNTLKLETAREQLRMFDDAIALADGTTLTLPTNSKISYALCDKNQAHTDSLSYFPPKPDGVDDATHQLACTGKLAYAPNDNTFVRAIVYDGGLGFFKINNNKIEFAHRHSIFDMNYGVLNAGVNIPIPNEQSQTGYVFVYATPKYFYASFSEAKAEENPEGLAKEIHMFDHEGNQVKRLLFDEEIGTFAVTADDSKLFTAKAATEDNTPISVYELH